MGLKKWVVLLIGIMMVLSLAACGSGQHPEPNATQNGAAKPEDDVEESMR